MALQRPARRPERLGSCAELVAGAGGPGRPRRPARTGAEQDAAASAPGHREGPRRRTAPQTLGPAPRRPPGERPAPRPSSRAPTRGGGGAPRLPDSAHGGSAGTLLSSLIRTSQSRPAAARSVAPCHGGSDKQFCRRLLVPGSKRAHWSFLPCTQSSDRLPACSQAHARRSCSDQNFQGGLSMDAWCCGQRVQRTRWERAHPAGSSARAGTRTGAWRRPCARRRGRGGPGRRTATQTCPPAPQAAPSPCPAGPAAVPARRRRGRPAGWRAHKSAARARALHGPVGGRRCCGRVAGRQVYSDTLATGRCCLDLRPVQACCGALLGGSRRGLRGTCARASAPGSSRSSNGSSGAGRSPPSADQLDSRAAGGPGSPVHVDAGQRNGPGLSAAAAARAARAGAAPASAADARVNSALSSGSVGKNESARSSRPPAIGRGRRARSFS